MIPVDEANPNFSSVHEKSLLKQELGACPRIGILFKIEKFLKNKHSHIVDIASIIFWKFRRVWAKGHSRTAS